jgi:YwiC-like protein
VSSYVPPQHGAWAFLALPVLLGALVAPWTPLILLLAIAWVAVYPQSYAAFGLVRAKRPERFRRPLLVWSAVAAVPAAVLLAARPWLVWVGAVYVLFFLVNLRYARRNDERALTNDLVFVFECAAMVLVTWAVGVGDRSFVPPPVGDIPVEAWVLTAVAALAMAGSTLHVKSLIRERRDPRYSRASQAFSVVCVVIAAGLAALWGLPAGWWLVVPFVALAARAFVVGRRPLKPMVIGLVELAGFVLLYLGAGLAVVASP